jgi:5'-nucleotidase
MSQNRRNFLKVSTLGGMSLVASSLPLKAYSLDDPDFVNITILHTNDVHSRVEPFPMDGGRNQGKGGVAKRAAIIENIRAQQKNVLLLDAGDIFQGTPYFNFFAGELEMKLMSALRYDAGTIGNHDFDAGIEGFEKQLKFANFPILNANYTLDDTVLYNKVIPYKIFKMQGVKIGVFGIGIKLEGLVPKKLFGNTVYNDPVQAADLWSKRLRHDMGCDYVVCLSHLGFKYGDSTISDHTLAANTEEIDLIIGGHTHTFLNDAVIVKNKVGDPVTINQVGFAGIMLGRLDLIFEKNRKGKCQTCSNSLVQ